MLLLVVPTPMVGFPRLLLSTVVVLDVLSTVVVLDVRRNPEILALRR